MEQRRPRITGASLAIAALGLAVGAALWTTGPAISEEKWAPAFLRGYAGAWVCYVLAAVVAARARRLPRWVLVWIVIGAVGLRLVALARTPPLSTDAYRYLWDGRMANAGINPFVYPPDAPELRSLRDSDWRQISYREVPTIYPPAAQVLFAGLAMIRAADIKAFRWTFALCDVGCVLLLIALLRRTDRPPERVIWYAWCPLPITETTAGAHVDPFALLLFLTAVLLLLRGTGKGALGSGIALAGAVMTKGYAVLALPLLARRGGWRLAASFVVGCALMLAPYVGAGSRLFGGLRAYIGKWETNASIFFVVNALLRRFTEDHFDITRTLTMAAVVVAAAVLTWRLESRAESLLRAAFLALGAQLILGAPTLPWYAIWVVPALCWWAMPGLALFTLTVSLQYYARWLYPGDMAADYALLWAGYVPVYALLIGQSVWWAVSRHRSAPSRTA